jgi:hypothetical protein
LGIGIAGKDMGIEMLGRILFENGAIVLPGIVEILVCSLWQLI